MTKPRKRPAKIPNFIVDEKGVLIRVELIDRPPDPPRLRPGKAAAQTEARSGSL
jgi:hypothetical protein